MENSGVIIKKLRGGSWFSVYDLARTLFRYYFYEDLRRCHQGFRVMRRG